MFRISAYGVYFSPHFKMKSPLRILSEYEIELYQSVSDNACGFLNGECIPYPKDQVCVFRTGQQRQSAGQFSCYYIKFSCDSPELCEVLDALPTVLSRCNSQQIYQLFSELFVLLSEQGRENKLLVYAKVCELVAVLNESHRLPACNSAKYSAYVGQVFEAQRYMREHLSEHITLEDIAASVHLSASFFHVVFKEIMLTTPHRHLLNIRLDHAKNLLVNSDLSLSYIAEICGFDSQVYFNYIIKKELGTTPKKYRDLHRNKYYTI